MVDHRLKELRGPGRRQFLRWAGTAAAAIGLERSKFLNFVNDTAGTAAADTAVSKSAFMISIADGGGGMANWTQVFPYPSVIGGTDPNFSHYALGKGIAGKTFDNPFTFAPDSPWQDEKWKVTAFVAGNNETHTKMPTTTSSVGQNGMLASAAAIQQVNPTLLPVLQVGANVFGVAPGAPAVAQVGAASGLVDLFNSQASKALLMTPENASLNEAYTKAFLGLNAAAGRTTTNKGYQTAKVAANLLGKNLAAQLTPTAADMALLGLTTASPPAVLNMGNSAITSIKAFALGLSSMLIVTGFTDDPHGLFAGGDAAAMAKAQAMGKMLDGIYNLSKQYSDPSGSGKLLSDLMVMTINGDTVKNGAARAGWGDGTKDGHNIIYVMGNGALKTGWIGNFDAPTNTVQAWDQGTGVTGGSYVGRGAELGASAGAAALYAVTRGDMRRVQDFYTGPAITGVSNIALT